MARATLVGRPGSPGLGVGRLLWVAGEEPARPVAASASAALEPAAERLRLQAALEVAAADLTRLAAETKARAGDEVGAIFDAQAMFASDPGIVDPAMAAIDEGATAEEAIDRVTAAQADALAAVDDEYFRERAADLRDVGHRVVDRLTGRERPPLHHADGAPAVLAADDLEPSAVVAIRPELVSGIALAGGAPTGHAAIVARALAIPLVLGLGGELRDRLDGVLVAVDGTAGRLLLEPNDDDLRDATPAGETVAGGTAHGLPVQVWANVGSVREAESAAAADAEGIGLVRTELLFMGRSTPPGLEEQRSLYRRIVEAAAGRPVVFRTLDIGGDKPVPYLSADREMNPALGVRGIRLSLARPDLFGTQLRALLEATAGGQLRLLLPMVSTIDEAAAARAAIDAAGEESRAAGQAIAGDVRVGVMIEVPSAAVMADALAPVVDFFSIGTNDLVQYALAVDRTSASLTDLASPLQPAVLRLVRSVVAAAGEHRRPVAVCGEAAADPLAAALFVGLGVVELSVAPSSIGRVRQLLAGLDLARCREAAERACASATMTEVRTIAAELIAPGASGGAPGGGPG